MKVVIFFLIATASIISRIQAKEDVDKCQNTSLDFLSKIKVSIIKFLMNEISVAISV